MVQELEEGLYPNMEGLGRILLETIPVESIFQLLMADINQNKGVEFKSQHRVMRILGELNKDLRFNRDE